MCSFYIPSVLITFLWGLWFLHVPGGKENNLGLYVKYILGVFFISLIPVLNIVVTVVSIFFLIIILMNEGIEKVFPTYKSSKFRKFLNYKFLKQK